MSLENTRHQHILTYLRMESIWSGRINFAKKMRYSLQISGRMKSRYTIRKETANYAREDCTAKRGSYKGPSQGGRTLNEPLETEAGKLT